MSKDPRFDVVLDANAPDFAERFREAIGAKPGEEIQFVTPQFTREAGRPGPGCPPSDAAGWEAMRSMTEQALREVGLRAWDRRDDGAVLMLFPGEWYSKIPAGYRVVSIGPFEDPQPEDEPFVPGETANDIRCGCLAYGLVVWPAPKEGTDGA